MPLSLADALGSGHGCSGGSGYIPPGMAGEPLLLVARLRGLRGESENEGAVCTGVASA